MNTVTLSSDFQITIPEGIREEMGLKAGQKFVFVPKGNTLLLVPERDVAWLLGIAKGANPEGYRDRTDDS